MAGGKRAIVVQVPLENGRPALGLPPGAGVYVEQGTPLVHVSWLRNGERHELLMERLGSVGGDRVFVCVGDRRIFEGLQHLGASCTLLKTAWADQQKRQWLANHGVEERNGRPVLRYVYSGDDATRDRIADDTDE